MTPIYHEVAAHEYPNGRISSGNAEGTTDPLDTVYLRLTHGEDDFTIHLRPDELASILMVGAATLAEGLAPEERDVS